MSETLTASQQASVAPAEGNLKRSIQMKWFASDEDKAKVGLLFTQTRDAAAASLVVGQVVGEIYAINRREGARADGEIFETIMALGDFEAVNYSTGEVITSPNAYLPRYFLETVEAFFKAGAKSMDVAVEIVVVPTGKSIPISYEVRPLLARQPTSGVNRMKLALQAAGRLHKALPPPAELTALPGEILALAPPTEAEEPDPADQGPQTPVGDAGAASAPAKAGGKAKAA